MDEHESVHPYTNDADMTDESVDPQNSAAYMMEEPVDYHNNAVSMPEETVDQYNNATYMADESVDPHNSAAYTTEEPVDHHNNATSMTEEPVDQYNNATYMTAEPVDHRDNGTPITAESIDHRNNTTYISEEPVDHHNTTPMTELTGEKVENFTPVGHYDGTYPTKVERIVLYGVDERPPIFQSLFLGIQHFLTFCGTGIAIPLILTGHLCMSDDPLAVSQLIGTAIFVEGIVTFIQVTFGLRLPVLQGASSAYLAAAIALLKTNGGCPYSVTANSTAEEWANYTNEYRTRIQEIQGAIMVAPILQVVVGFTGIVGFLLKFIGPVTIAPVIAFVGLSVVGPAASRAGSHWGIATLTIVLIILFSQVLRKVHVPVLGWKGGQCGVTQKVPVFSMFPIVLGVILAWVISYVFTITDVFPTNPAAYGYKARTDLQPDVVNDSPWFRVPYPGQWGLPFVTIAGVIGMFSAVVASIIDSLGDYYAVARMAGAQPPPPHAVNRALLVEGIGCILAAAFGTANGTTTFSTNAGLIGLTRVGSLFVLQICAVIMVIFGMLGKFTAFISTIPVPIIGGIMCILFGMVLAVGLSNLQFVDLNSSRNLLIIGFSLFMGILVPSWTDSNFDLYVQTGNSDLDRVIKVMLTTEMFIGGMFAFTLDNIVPGTLEERGIIAFNKEYSEESSAVEGISSIHTYDFPFGMSLIRNWNCTRYIPFCPTFVRKGVDGGKRGGGCCRNSNEYNF